MSLLRPTLDVVFKGIFGTNDNANVLMHLLNSLNLDVDRITEITITNSEVVSTVATDKLSRMDITAKTQSGELINIEIQVSNTTDMVNRSLYYWRKLFSSSLKSGDQYSELPMTIMINILDYNHWTGLSPDD